MPGGFDFSLPSWRTPFVCVGKISDDDWVDKFSDLGVFFPMGGKGVIFFNDPTRVIP